MLHPSQIPIDKIRDLTANCPVREAANSCMAVIDAVQKYPKRSQLMGITTAFLLASEQAGLSVSDLMAYARNCINTAEGKRPEFKAAEVYIEKEIIHGYNN